MENADQIAEFIRGLALWSVPVLAAVILHEIAHGAVALRLGDDTAQRMGRLTLNPLPHIDPIGTIVLPALLFFAGAPVFGYARPVPINYAKLRVPRRDMALVAVAGPLTNVALAVASAVVFRLLYGWLGGLTASPEGLATRVVATVLVPLALMAQRSVVINVVLAVFNLLPVPPLDGGRVLTGILPAAHARRVAAIEPFGFLIVVVLLTTRTLGVILEVPIQLLLRMLP
jgi:Zn-dependent protease